MVSQAMQVLISPNSDKKDKPRINLNLNENASNLLIIGAWDEIVSLIPFYNNSVFIDGIFLDLIFVFQNRNFIEMYNPKTNVWTKSIDYGFNRRNFSAAKVDNKIMVIGGFASGRGLNNVVNH